MILAIVGIALAFLTVMILLSRMGRNRKQQAITDFERERDATKTPDILQLVRDEVAELGIDKIDGSEDINPSVLLQVFRRDEGNCEDDGSYRFVLAKGIKSEDASLETLALSSGED
ncbi:MAG: hypothetical protein BMS9Abin07_2307 [Acidimicrobiia bacterium]|nr:MAG: hypothetical protein BMS9Abin07_2307 [Acidimicrobiia bacterium]